MKRIAFLFILIAVCIISNAQKKRNRVSRTAFHNYLKKLVDAGLTKRLMFGSDQMIWPETIELAIDAINSADFLSQGQKRDIFYNNAARFLRLDENTIKMHHE